MNLGMTIDGQEISLKVHTAKMGSEPRTRETDLCGSVCPKAERSGLPIGSDLLRKYDYFSIRQEIWWKYLSRASRDFETHVDALSLYQYQATGNLNSISSEPCRLPKSTYFPKRLVPFTKGVFQTAQEILGTRLRHL
ncbi:hypothetical protein AYI68_g8213 [Smittium mucronatum]|uniref:Uncharacterized protein n=1 Tax=Smittium mucronatum TaxID=133383 RepID=A0A1R0GLJ5_9FUNG|nr:hypothetical protein AYI68_g8213 [Smittium mucronatum]